MAANGSKVREESGRFRKGVSGNPAGRPRKKPKPVRSLGQMLADELMREVTFEVADGTKRKGTQYEMICANIIANLKVAKPKEAIAVLKEFEELGVLEDVMGQQDRGLAVLQKESRDFLKRMRNTMPEGAAERLKPRGTDARSESVEDDLSEPPEDELDEDGEDDET